MKYTDLKVGDKIKILIRPQNWSSHFSNESPLNIKYPFVGIIEKIKQIEGHTAARIGKYEFSLNKLNFEILKKDIIYEIY